MTAPQAMNEEQMVFLVRNALLVAGQELGKGDSWPVVKDTIYKIMKDLEDLKVERRVDDELRAHLFREIQKIEGSLPECPDDIRETLEPRIRDLREACEAYFTDISDETIPLDDEDKPMHIQRMTAILNTMEEDHE